MPPASDTRDAEALFESYHDRIYRYVLRLVRDPSEAEDLTQDTFLRAFRRRDSLREPEAVQAWLYRIATNVSLDRLRQRAPHLSIESKEGSALAQSAVSASPSALKITEQKEMSECVQRYLHVLPDSYRAVILLHHVHSLTAAQIAALLGVRLSAVKIRLHRGRRKLQQALQDGCTFSNDNHGVLICQPKS